MLVLLAMQARRMAYARSLSRSAGARLLSSLRLLSGCLSDLTLWGTVALYSHAGESCRGVSVELLNQGAAIGVSQLVRDVLCGQLVIVEQPGRAEVA